MAMMVAQICEYIKTTKLYIFKGWILWFLSYIWIFFNFNEKRNERLINVVIWINLVNIPLSEKETDTEGHILYDSIHMKGLE